MAHDCSDITAPEIETHPWPPFIPDKAKILIMGTFPPGNHRWSMDFYYPNPINDFWRMIGLIFLGDKDALWLPGEKRFDVDAIRHLMAEKHIALNDTGRKVRRLKGNASDKFLEIVEPVPLSALLEDCPTCRTVATTGEKAAQVVADITGTPLPKMGHMVVAPDFGGRPLEIWRMPSTSRAYPLALAKKAEYYAHMFESAGILPRYADAES